MTFFSGPMKKWLFLPVLAGVLGLAAAHASPEARVDFPAAAESYADSAQTDLLAKLAGRVRKDPFNAVATMLFLGAIVHTFFAAKFREISRRYENEHAKIRRRLAAETSNARALERAADEKKNL